MGYNQTKTSDAKDMRPENEQLGEMTSFVTWEAKLPVTALAKRIHYA